MRNILFLVFLFSIGNINSQSRTTVNFGSDWEFKREEANANWEIITIPHTEKLSLWWSTISFKGTVGIKKSLLFPMPKTRKFSFILKA